MLANEGPFVSGTGRIQVVLQVCLILASLVYGSLAAYAYSMATEVPEPSASGFRMAAKLAMSTTLVLDLYYSFWHGWQVRKVLVWRLDSLNTLEKRPPDDQSARHKSIFDDWLDSFRRIRIHAWPLQKDDLPHLVESTRIGIVGVLRIFCLAECCASDKTWFLQVRLISAQEFRPADSCRYHQSQVQRCFYRISAC